MGKREYGLSRHGPLDSGGLGNVCPAHCKLSSRRRKQACASRIARALQVARSGFLPTSQPRLLDSANGQGLVIELLHHAARGAGAAIVVVTPDRAWKPAHASCTGRREDHPRIPRWSRRLRIDRPRLCQDRTRDPHTVPQAGCGTDVSAVGQGLSLRAFCMRLGGRARRQRRAPFRRRNAICHDRQRQ